MFAGSVPDVLSPLSCRAQALRLPISLADAHRMTASQLAEAVGEAFVKSEEFNPADARNHALGEYVRTRNEIVKRIKAEMEAGK